MKRVGQGARSSLRNLLWIVVAILLVAGFLCAATAREVYQATSPHSLIAHVWFRKLYSIIAFAIVGAIAARVLRAIPYPRRIALSSIVVAGYSALIEVAQKFHGSTESWRWNLFDVGCGLIGGAIGAALYRIRSNH
ncbi:MAG: hypothetical protein JO177_06540 [Candidatus Eremiobacteraeota bacterium]|nr:hypothetical protein [Candidatus Eremiobacteraeota bacterium]